eukprot:Em0013g956a
MAVALHVLVLLLLWTQAMAANTFRFANMFGDHMVLQRAPRSANIWGYVGVTSGGCDQISVVFNGRTATAKLIQDNSTMCRWVVSLPPTSAIGPFNITAISKISGSISLSDVLFGDVYICSGQSNMQFTVSEVFNASEEIAMAANYPHIRLFTASLQSSSTPVLELLQVEQQWSVASPASVGGPDWGYFSATCWFFGRNLYDQLQYPIGLIDTDWGGTRVEAWSSPDALAKCNASLIRICLCLCFSESFISKMEGPDPNTATVLWNAMIYPFLNVTIFGAIWYQGEANAGYTNYNCTFPAMIDDWRAKWYTSSYENTDPMFPFGFVQVSDTNVVLGTRGWTRWGLVERNSLIQVEEPLLN